MSDAKAKSTSLESLVVLQEVDTSLEQLQYRRGHLPAHTALVDVQNRAAVLRPALLAATSHRDAIASRQSHLETEIAGVTERIGQITARLYGSSPIGPRDAQVMSEELEHLKARKKRLEDDDLVVMEELEQPQAGLAQLEAGARALAVELRALQDELAQGQAEIDQEYEHERARREQLAANINSGLLEEYDRLRHTSGGVAIARVVGSTCGGCHLSLSATEVDRLRKADVGEILHCEECGRILVR